MLIVEHGVSILSAEEEILVNLADISAFLTAVSAQIYGFPMKRTNNNGKNKRFDLIARESCNSFGHVARYAPLRKAKTYGMIAANTSQVNL